MGCCLAGLLGCQVSLLLSEGLKNRSKCRVNSRRGSRGSESRLEGGGVNRAKTKFTKLITTASRVSVRNIIESARGGAKQNASEYGSETQGFVLPRFGSCKPTPR
jgi:hypothetical protein